VLNLEKNNLFINKKLKLKEKHPFTKKRNPKISLKNSIIKIIKKKYKNPILNSYLIKSNTLISRKTFHLLRLIASLLRGPI
jgi:hypothetical protein